MGTIPERRRLRRESFRKIGKIYAKAIGRVTLMVGLAGGMAILGLSILYWMGIDLGHRQPDKPILPVVLFFLFIVVGASWLNHRCVVMVEKAQEEAGKIHVPPIAANALPVEEILLRSSEPPAALESEMLLRPAHGSQATDTDELLRPMD